jgi:hypothetical protein
MEEIGIDKKQAIITFTNRSKFDAIVSSHLDKIVLVSRESPVKEPKINVPYMCTFEVYDTNPQSAMKGARIVKVIHPMEINSMEIFPEPHGIKIILYCNELNASCMLSSGTFDPRCEIKRLMKELKCHVDYKKIDKILNIIKKRVSM